LGLALDLLYHLKKKKNHNTSQETEMGVWEYSKISGTAWKYQVLLFLFLSILEYLSPLSFKLHKKIKTLLR